MPEYCGLNFDYGNDTEIHNKYYQYRYYQPPTWYFDQSSNQCKTFSYSGSGGNKNNFPDKDTCEKKCKKSHCE